MENNDSFSDLSVGDLDIEQILQSSDDDDDVEQEILATPSHKQQKQDKKNDDINDIQKKEFESLIHPQNNKSQTEETKRIEYDDILKRKRKQREEEDEAQQVEKERKENKLNAINPLDLIDKEQGDIMKNENQVFQNFEKELILSRTRLPNDYNMEYNNLEALSSFLYPQLGVEQEFMSNKNYGLPKAMCILPNKLIIVGTSYGMIVMFDIYSYKIVQVIGTYDDYRKYGSVNTVDVNKEGDAILVGFEKGGISLYETYSGSCIKQILGVHENTILAAKFWKGRERFISSDLSGNVYIFKIEKVWLVSYSFDKQRLLKKPDNPYEIIYNVEILQERHYYNTELSRINSTIVALSSAVSVIIITLDPSVKKLYEIEAPSILKQPSLPCVSWGRGRAPYQTMENMDYPILAVGWGALMQLYQMNKFAIMQVTSSQNVVSEGFDIIGHLVLDHSIFHMQWISFSMIYLLNSRNEFRIIYTGEAVGGQYQGESGENNSTYSSQQKLPSTQNIGSSNTLAASNAGSTSKQAQQLYVKHNYLMEQEINFMFYVKDTQNKSKRTFSNSVVVSNSDVYITTSKGIVKGHFFEWNECIFKYIKQKQWAVALKIAMMLQHGKLQSFARLPDKIDPVQKKDFTETCEKLFLSYLEKEKSRIERQVPQSDKSEEVWRFKKICFEYLTEVRDFETLFKDARRCIMELDSNEAFHTLLEPFILWNKIKRIPSDDYFDAALKFFLDRKKFNVVQIMIVNLDLSSINLYETLKQCVKHQLFTPLIYISTRKDNDFISSLVKMYNEYQQVQRESNNDNTGEKYIYRCLWFIRLTLQQKMYPNEPIDDSKFPTALRTVVSWFFSDQIVIDFARVDSTVYFEVVYLLFEGKPAQILREKNDLLFKYFQYDSDKKEEGMIQYANYVHEQMIKKIQKLLKGPMNLNQNKKMKRDFYSFIGRVAHFQEIPIDLAICKESAEFLLQDNSSVTTEKEIQLKQSNILALVKRMSKQHPLLDSLLELIPKIDQQNDANLDDMQKSVEQNIKNLQSSSTKDQNQTLKVNKMIEEFKEFQKQRFIQEKVNLEIFAYCEYLTGNLYKAFEQYQRMMEQSSHRGNRYKIFSWLYEAFRNEALTEAQKEQLKGYIIDNIKTMILTSTRYTKNVVHTFLREKEPQIFESLLGDQTLLLDYLECLLEDRQKSPQQQNANSQNGQQQNLNNSDAISNDTLALYITLLCKVDPQRVVQELKTNFYPLDFIIKYCRLNNASDAVAYICEKQGNYQEAIQLYSKIFLEECAKTFLRITKGRHLTFEKESETDKDKESAPKQLSYAANATIQTCQNVLNMKFKQLIEACKSQSKAEADHQILWSDMAGSILSCKEAPQENQGMWKEIADYINTKQDHFEIVNQIFSNIIANLFIEISNFLSIQDIIQLVKTYQKQFSFQSIKDSFTQILTTLAEEIVFLEEGKQVLLQDLIKQNINFLKKTTQGNSYGIQCNHPQCGNYIYKITSNIIVFTCGHQYHQHCLDKYSSYNNSSHKRKKAIAQAAGTNSTVYQCTICMKEEIPYLQQIEQELQQVSQKLLNINVTTNPATQTDINNNSTIFNNQLNKDYNSSQCQESQKDSQSVATEKSNKKDFKEQLQKFREKQQKRLKIFDNFIQQDMDNFEKIRQKYENQYS